MFNETLATQTLLNETSITQTISGILVPSVAIVMSSIVTIYVAYMSIKYNSKSIFVMANKDKINEIIKNLAVAARSGKIEKVEEIMNSKDNYYIPEELKRKIMKEINRELPSNPYYTILKKIDNLLRWLTKGHYPTSVHNRILRVINKYISP